MRPLGDICKKRKKLFCLSKNYVTSNCSTLSPVGPIVYGIVPFDAHFNKAYFVRVPFLWDASFRRYVLKTETIILFLKKLSSFKLLFCLTSSTNRFRNTTIRCVV